MITIAPDTIRLWVMYQEDNSLQTGEVDIKVNILDGDNTEILSDTVLTEEGSTGLYYYDWDASGRDLETIAKVFYKKGTDILFSEEYYFDDLEDQDAMAM